MEAHSADDLQRQADIRDAVAQIVEDRASVEQVKGLIMYFYRVDADAAFELLRAQSNKHNVKIRALAEQLLVDVQDPSHYGGPLQALEFDQLLRTAHERVGQAD